MSSRVQGGRLVLTVCDTGRGIAPERLPHLFELDFSRQGSRVKLSLGLPSSRGVVEAIGGVLRIESELGRGTSVQIELPLAAAPFGGWVAAAAPSSQPAPSAAASAVSEPAPSDAARSRAAVGVAPSV